MFIMIVIGFIATVYVWSQFGPVLGLITAFFLMGGVGWKLLYGLLGALGPSRRERMEFVQAWEARAGEMQFGQSNSYPPPGAYQQWRRDKKTTGESAGGWLDRIAGS